MPDLIYAHSTGNIEDKTQYVGKMKAGTQRYAGIEPGPTTVRLHGNAAITHSTVRMHGVNAKGPFDDRVMMIHMWVKSGGKWKLAGEIGNHHGRFAEAVREAENAKFALYDLEQDIGEKNDLSAKHPDIYADLKKRHLEWLRQFAVESTLSNAASSVASPETAKEKKRRMRPKEKAKAKIFFIRVKLVWPQR